MTQVTIYDFRVCVIKGYAASTSFMRTLTLAALSPNIKDLYPKAVMLETPHVDSLVDIFS